MKKSLLSCAVVFLVLASINIVRADAPPPSDFTVQVQYDNAPVADDAFPAVILQCKERSLAPSDTRLDLGTRYADATCAWHPAKEAVCQKGQCAFGWVLGDFKVAAYIPSLKMVFVSNPLTREYLGHYGFDTPRTYALSLRADGSATLADLAPSKSARSPYEPLVIAVVLTIGVESAVAWFFLRRWKASKNLYWALVAGNIITVPFVWLFVGTFTTLVVAEVLAVVFEAWLYHAWARKTLSWKKAFLLSGIANALSWLIGALSM